MLTSGDSEATLSYPWLEDLILSYKLNQHLQFLFKFRGKFRRIDKDNTGIISAAKVASLLRHADPRGLFDQQKVLKEAASRRKTSFNFTEAVSLAAAAEPLNSETPAGLLEALNAE